MTAEELVRFLGLEPLPTEGGWYRETWRSEHPIAATALPPEYGGARALGTAIYYLVTPRSFSRLHRLPGVEVFHFYLGDPVQMLQLLPDRRGLMSVLGRDLEAGERPQVVVPAGAWQGTRLVPGGTWALLGTTLAPGFDPADYKNGDRRELTEGWPDFREWIERLMP